MDVWIIKLEAFQCFWHFLDGLTSDMLSIGDTSDAETWRWLLCLLRSLLYISALFGIRCHRILISIGQRVPCGRFFTFPFESFHLVCQSYSLLVDRLQSFHTVLRESTFLIYRQRSVNCRSLARFAYTLEGNMLKLPRFLICIFFFNRFIKRWETFC